MLPTCESTCDFKFTHNYIYISRYGIKSRLVLRIVAKANNL